MNVLDSCVVWILCSWRERERERKFLTWKIARDETKKHKEKNRKKNLIYNNDAIKSKV